MGGNVNKTDRMSAKDMIMELKNLVDEGEIQEEEVPEIKTIEGWITRYSASLRRESAEKRVAENNESGESEEKRVVGNNERAEKRVVENNEGRFERDGENIQEQKRQKI